MRSVLGAGKELRHRGWTRIWKHYVGDAGLPYRLGRGCLRSPQRPGWSLLEHSRDREPETRLGQHVARTRRELEVAPRILPKLGRALRGSDHEAKKSTKP